MSGSIAGFTVALDHDLSMEDGERVLSAIRQLRGVTRVGLIESDILAQSVGEMRMHSRLSNKIIHLLQETSS